MHDDPRSATSIENPLGSELSDTSDRGAVLIHSTKHSKLRVAAAMEHVGRGPRSLETRCECFADNARFTVAGTVEPGKRLTIVKFVAYGWSSLRSVPALRAQVDGALASALEHGWDGLAEAQRKYLADFWSHSDVELKGDDEVQQAIHFAMFHVLQSAARAEQRAIPAKGLTGPGYDGHTFWDMETFVLPVLTYTAPGCVADALPWRHSIRGGEFRIDGVTGPDEYSAIADNNLYTNLMAQRNLNGAADAAERHASVARRLKVSAKEIKAWRKAATAIYIPFEPDLRIHKQASQFTDHQAWDFEGTKPDQYPLFLHFPYFDLYRKQVIKQADLVLAMHLRGH